jgi:hypothetical protein
MSTPAQTSRHIVDPGQETTMSNLDPTVVIRAARGSDGPALVDLAELDSRRPLAGDVLVGEQDGRIVAAYAPASDAAIADPFRPTADVVALLELHARRARPARPRHRFVSSLPRLRAA